MWNFSLIISFLWLCLVEKLNVFGHENVSLALGKNLNDIQHSDNEILSRKRRFIAFPEGASFSVAVCATVGVIGNINPAYLSYGLNWGVAYDLPNQTWVLNNINGFKNNQPYRNTVKDVVKRSSRQTIYNVIENAVTKMGYNGRDCILRALCESTKYFFRKGNNMVEEMIRIIFSFPLNRVYSHEHKDILEYDKAFRNGKNVKDCSVKYTGCHFSLIELALGKYSQPPPGYWD